MSKYVHCPACGCDVTDRVVNAAATKLSKRMNQQYVKRVAKLLTRAEDAFQDPTKQSNGQLWRGDVRAIRYVFNRLVALTNPVSPVVSRERDG